MTTYITNYLQYQVCQGSDYQYFEVTGEQIEQIVDMLETKFGYVRIFRGDME